MGIFQQRGVSWGVHLRKFEYVIVVEMLSFFVKFVYNHLALCMISLSDKVNAPAHPAVAVR